MRLNFSEDGRRFLRTTGERYPYAYGYLSGQVRSFLDGEITRKRLEAVLNALETELGGEACG